MDMIPNSLADKNLEKINIPNSWQPILDSCEKATHLTFVKRVILS